MMPEKTKGIWTRYQRRLKETECDAGKGQEIQARCRRRDRIRASTEEYKTDGGSNPGKYWRIQDRNDHIRVSTKEEIISGRVPKNGRIRVSTEKWQIPGEYRRKVRASTGKGVDYGLVLEKGTGE